MFGSRLNPTKPAAAHRAALERVGFACREIRALHESAVLPESAAQLHRVFAKNGLFGIGIAAEYGGVDVHPLLSALVHERIGREGTKYVSWFLWNHGIAVAQVNRFGQAALKRQLLSQLATGEHAAIFASRLLNFDAPRTGITIERIADRFVVHGRDGCTLPPRAAASIVIIGHSKDSQECTAFLAEAGEPGVRLERNVAVTDTTWECAARAEVVFDNYVVKPGKILGNPGDGWRLIASARSDTRLGQSAGCLGVLADWLEVLTMLVADRLKAGNWQVERAAIERHVADVATNLEALRGIVYAAAELQHELDRRPMSEHLAAETETLVGEASHFAGRAMHQLRSEAESILVGDCNLLDFFPTRQRPDQQSDWFKEPASYLQRQIAAYYLGLSPIAMPR